MWRYKIRSIVLTGFVCVFMVWTTPVRSQEQDQAQDAKPEKVEEVKPIKPEKPPDPKAATTAEDLNIPVDELKILVKPLTQEELQNESASVQF
jgi:small conductance mechanosensitive channel